MSTSLSLRESPEAGMSTSPQKVNKKCMQAHPRIQIHPLDHHNRWWGRPPSDRSSLDKDASLMMFGPLVNSLNHTPRVVCTGCGKVHCNERGMLYTHGTLMYEVWSDQRSRGTLNIFIEEPSTFTAIPLTTMSDLGISSEEFIFFLALCWVP